MDAKMRLWLLLPVLVLFFSSSSLNSLSIAAETISPGQSLSGDETISSKGNTFELGFFTPGKSQNYYIGIWYKDLPERTVVWVANRETPLSAKSSAQLKINPDGNLVLLNQFKRPVWSTNISSPASNSTIAELLDTGNLILRDGSNSSALIWQSFDHLTDTWLPKGKVGRNKVTGERQRTRSWKSPDDPAPGLFSLELDPTGLNQFVILWNGTEVCWSSGVWNGQYFTNTPGGAAPQPFKVTFVETENETYGYFDFLGDTFTRSVMQSSGQVSMCVWLKPSRRWSCLWSVPLSQCDIVSYCGAFGICTQNLPGVAPCSCLDGFVPRSPGEWNVGNWTDGCKRKTQLPCGGKSSVGAEQDGFLLKPHLKLPVKSQLLPVTGAAECKLACSDDCSCTAYTYGDNECFVWNEDLLNLQQLSDNDASGRDLYLRLAVTELQSLSHKKSRSSRVFIGVMVGCASAFCCVIVLLIWRYQRGRLQLSLKKVQGPLVSFSYRDLQIMTKNFSEKLGRGSFGSVFKGSFPDSTLVAVKKLEGIKQGEKQFQAEVSTIGTIQHVNLIRLRGFCSQGSHRMLVYDYMPYGSLDSHLFRENSGTLDWKIRYQIALGTARGLAYLHEKCRDQIVHCDIKPENVLLDSSFVPRLADFGLAKLIGRDFSRVLTSMRGTIGYLAPEWISGVAITPKADVYSYGMMLFEIISGKRNTEQLGDGESAFFPCWAAGKLANGEVLDLLDHRLDASVHMEELSRVFKVAFWCIQDNADDRPSMGNVVYVLEGVKDVNMPPIPRSIKILIDNSF